MILFILLSIFIISILIDLNIENVKHYFKDCSNINNNLSEFSYNYLGTDLEQEEKKVLNLAKDFLIEEDGLCVFNKNKPYSTERKSQGTWHISNSYCRSKSEYCISDGFMINLGSRLLK